MDCRAIRDLAYASAMLTRFRSPPETPRTKSLPTIVLTVWLRPKTAIVTSRRCAAYTYISIRLLAFFAKGIVQAGRLRALTSRLTPGRRLRGALQKSVENQAPIFSLTYRRASGKVDSLAHGQLGEVLINLSLVNALSPEVSVHGLFRDALVVDIGLLSDEEAICLSSKSLQQRRAATATVSYDSLAALS